VDQVLLEVLEFIGIVPAWTVGFPLAYLLIALFVEGVQALGHGVTRTSIVGVGLTDLRSHTSCLVPHRHWLIWESEGRSSTEATMLMTSGSIAVVPISSSWPR
jgi:hypothetical protein